MFGMTEGKAVKPLRDFEDCEEELKIMKFNEGSWRFGARKVAEGGPWKTSSGEVVDEIWRTILSSDDLAYDVAVSIPTTKASAVEEAVRMSNELGGRPLWLVKKEEA